MWKSYDINDISFKDLETYILEFPPVAYGVAVRCELQCGDDAIRLYLCCASRVALPEISLVLFC